VSPCAQLVIVRCVFLLLSVYCGQLLEHDVCLVVLFVISIAYIIVVVNETKCVRGDTICPRPL